MDWWITFDQQAADYLPDLRIAKEEPMDRHTSFRIGGPARRMAFPERGEQLVLLLDMAARCGARPLVMGNGTNLLAPDEGLDRLVIDTSAGLNRVEAGEFPNTIPAVIFDRKHDVQFTPVSNGTVYLPPTAQSIQAAKRALNGENTAGKALYFYAPALSQGTWINANRTYLMTIGCHRFYL